MTRSALAIGGLAVGLSAGALGGCSAVVGDIGGIQANPEACVQGANTEVVRDARFVFANMDPHRNAPTFMALVGGSGVPGDTRPILRGRAYISPSFAASDYDPSLLGLDMPERCAMAAPTPLTMDFTIPAFLPADGPNGGPFEVDFWCETNGTPGRQFGGAGGDHTWVRPVCDDGNVFFVHNTGFDSPIMAQTNGNNLKVSVEAASVAISLRAAAESIARIPFILTIRRQDQTVGYIQAIYACDQGPYVLNGIMDAGTIHQVEAYFDVGLNGVYDPECDPHCAGNISGDANIMDEPTTALIFTGTPRRDHPEDFDVGRSCSVPAGFSTAGCMPR